MADPKHPRHYDEAFKRQIVQLYENGKPAREIKDEYDISHSTLHRWFQGIRNSGSTKAADNRTPEQNEPVELRKRNRQLEMEVDVSEQAALIFARKCSDTGQRLPLSDIGAVQDTGRSPLHLLLDDRTSRSRAGGPDRRRRARGPARQPRTLRRQEDQGRLGKEGRHRVQEAHRQHHARTGHDERVHTQTIRTARDAG